MAVTRGKSAASAPPAPSKKATAAKAKASPKPTPKPTPKSKETNAPKCPAGYPNRCADYDCGESRAKGSEKRCYSAAVDKMGGDVKKAVCCASLEAVRLKEEAAAFLSKDKGGKSLGINSFVPPMKGETPLRKRMGSFFKVWAMLMQAKKQLARASDVFTKNGSPQKATATIREVIKLVGSPYAKTDDSSTTYGNSKSKPKASVKDVDPVPCSTAPKELDAWQKACAIPALAANLPDSVRKQMLLVADTGTGKSFAWSLIARTFYDAGIQLVVVVKNQYQQFSEMAKSPAWHDMACTDGSGRSELQRVTTIGRSPLRPIMILSYVQAGNVIKNGGSKGDLTTLDGTAVLMDEIHELANPESAGSWADSLRQIQPYFLKEKPAYHFLLGATATPLIDPESFVKLMGMFTPANMTKLKLADLELKDAMGTDTQASERVSCGVKAQSVASMEVLVRKMQGLPVFYYSADRDDDNFPSFRDLKVLTVTIKQNAKSADASVMRAGWNKPVKMPIDTKLDHSSRLQQIVANAAEPVFDMLVAHPKKTAIFMTTKGMANSMLDQLKKKDMARKSKEPFEFFVITDDLPGRTISEVKAKFGAAGPRAVLVSHQVFGQEHTFDSERSPAHKGIRRLVSVQMKTLARTMQMEGRARRRMSHAAYPKDERDVERVVIIPQYEGGPKTKTSKPAKKDAGPNCNGLKKAECVATSGCEYSKRCKKAGTDAAAADDVVAESVPKVDIRRSCEAVFLDLVAQERVNYQRIMSALFEISYGRDAFWKRRPIVDTVKTLAVAPASQMATPAAPGSGSGSGMGKEPVKAGSPMTTPNWRTKLMNVINTAYKSLNDTRKNIIFKLANLIARKVPSEKLKQSLPEATDEDIKYANDVFFKTVFTCAEFGMQCADLKLGDTIRGNTACNKRLAQIWHPDKKGSKETFQALNACYKSIDVPSKVKLIGYKA